MIRAKIYFFKSYKWHKKRFEFGWIRTVIIVLLWFGLMEDGVWCCYAKIETHTTTGRSVVHIPFASPSRIFHSTWISSLVTVVPTFFVFVLRRRLLFFLLTTNITSSSSSSLSSRNHQPMQEHSCTDGNQNLNIQSFFLPFFFHATFPI